MMEASHHSMPHPDYPDYVPGAACRVNFQQGGSADGELTTCAFNQMGAQVVVGTNVSGGYLRVELVELV